MKPGEPLFDAFSAQIEEVTPKIYAHEEMRSLTTSLLGHAREACATVAVPRLGHHRMALQREMNAEGVLVPNGKVYRTPSYEDFALGESPTPDEPSLEVVYENRLLIHTNDADKSKGRVHNFLDRLLDESRPKHKGTFVVFGTVTPKDVTNITAVEAVTFAVVQANSGEAFGFTFTDNPNKGKVRPTEGTQDEFGDRLRAGYIDMCPVQAVGVDNGTMANLRLELEKAAETLTDQSEDELDTSESGLARVQALGRTMLEKIGYQTKVGTS